MKIDAYNHIAQINRIDEVRAPQRAQAASAVGRDQVSLSSDASFLTDLRGAMSQLGDIRSDVVEQTRAEVEAGQIGTEDDFQHAIDALLMEL